MNFGSLFAAAKASAKQRAPPARSSPYIPAKISIEMNHVHFLALFGKQRGMMFRGPVFRNFLSTLKGNPGMAPLFDRNSNMGLLTTGHRFRWGKPDETLPYVSVWGFLQEPANESKIMAL